MLTPSALSSHSRKRSQGAPAQSGSRPDSSHEAWDLLADRLAGMDCRTAAMAARYYARAGAGARTSKPPALLRPDRLSGIMIGCVALLFVVYLTFVDGHRLQPVPAVQASSLPEETARGVPAAELAPVTIAMAGDVLPNHVASPFSGVEPLLSAADITFANLECPLSEEGRPIAAKFADGRLRENEFLFRCVPQSARILADAGIDVVSLANNHAMDYGPRALTDTVQCLSYAGIESAGASDGGPVQCVVIERHGTRVAFLAYVASTTLPGATAFAASDGRSGVAVLRGEDDRGLAPASRARLQCDIKDARGHADIVIVSCHWGRELMTTPTALQRDIAHTAIDCGADAVVGHHPHCLQPVESYRGRPILYSLGNFVFPAYRDSTARTAVAWLRLDGHTASVALLGARIQGSRPHWISGAAAQRMAEQMCHDSDGFGGRAAVAVCHGIQAAVFHFGGTPATAPL